MTKSGFSVVLKRALKLKEKKTEKVEEAFLADF